MLSGELAHVPAHELAARIRGRDRSPVQVVEAFIRRIEARNSREISCLPGDNDVTAARTIFDRVSN